MEKWLRFEKQGRRLRTVLKWPIIRKSCHFDWTASVRLSPEGPAASEKRSVVCSPTLARPSSLPISIKRNLRRSRPSCPNGSSIECDITDESSVKAAFGGIGRLDILVNNAGIGLVGGVEETELNDFQRLFRVNVEGTFLVTKYAVPLLTASHGSIVNIGSVAGLVGLKKRFAYCATKGAVVAMTRQLAVDYPTEFRVNCICPGTVDTPFVEAYLEKYHKHEKEQVRTQLNQRQPVGRLGKPMEIANLALISGVRRSGIRKRVDCGNRWRLDGGLTAAKPWFCRLLS